MNKFMGGRSAVTLGNFLDFFLFLKGVGRLKISFLNVDELISQNLSNTLLGSEGMLSHSLGDQIDGLIDSSEGRNVHSLLSHNTTSSNSGGVLSGTSLDNCVDKHLKGVSSGKEINNLKSMSDNSDSLHLFTSVSPVELERSDETLNNWTESLPELFGLVAASSVWHEDLSLG